MASFITTQATPGGGTEENVLMSNSSFARPINLPSSWQKVRIGVRMWISDLGTGPSSTPRLGVGLCSGTTNLVGDSTTTYFVGVITNTATWSYSGNPNFVYNTIAPVPCTRTGSVLTTGTTIIADARFSTTGSQGNLLFVDITKGTPNYTFNVFAYTGVNQNVASTTFQQQMPLASPSVTGHGFGSSQTLAVNEALSGSLNAVAVWWNRSDLLVNIMDIAVAILQ